MEVPSLARPLERGIALRRVLAVGAFCAAIGVAAFIVAAQPLRSPWWTYADADAAYSASGLDLLGGVNIRYLDHPGLPLEELAAAAFGAQHAVQRATGDHRSTIQFVDASMLNFETVKPIWRGLAVAFYLAGSILAFVLASRLFGHWLWGFGAALLWLGAPGLATMSIEFRPDVPLSVLLVVSAYLIGRGAQERSQVHYLLAALVLGLTMMVKMHAAGMLVALALVVAFRPPEASWGARLRESAAALWHRRRPPLAAGALLWIALAVLLNRHWLRYHPSHKQDAAALGPVLVVAGFAGACRVAARLAPASRLRARVLDGFYAAVAGALLVGLWIPITFDVPDGLESLIRIKDGLAGGGINSNIPAFSTPLDQLTQFPLKQGLVLFVVAGLAAAVGLWRRDPLPLAWFAGAAVLGVMAQARLADIHYFAPAFVVSMFGALWLLHAFRHSVLMPVAAVALVAYVVVPQFQYRTGQASYQRNFAKAEAPSFDYLRPLLKPGEIALTPSAWPDASTRYFDLVEPYVNYTPPYPYTFLSASSRALSLALSRGFSFRYYTGPDVHDLQPGDVRTIQLGDIGPYRVRRLPGPDVVALLSGPGVRKS